MAAHAAAYDARAETFAERTAVMPPELAALGERVLSRFPARARILDVGRGPGRDRAWFEERGATAVGVDVSPRMLELARARCAGDLLELDMRGLAPPAASFDLVWPIASLLQLPKAEGEAAGVLREFRRFVKPDGAVVIRSSAARASGGNRWARPRGDSLARYEPEELRAALAAAGLVADAVEQTTSDRDEEWLLATAVPAG